MEDGIINPGPGAPFGFSEELFGISYLWKQKNSIYLSLIISERPKEGNLRALIERILAAGYTVKIPAPRGRMLYIVKKNGYKRTLEPAEIGQCEVWVKKPNR